jgi:hypothetical protein
MSSKTGVFDFKNTCIASYSYSYSYSEKKRESEREKMTGWCQGGHGAVGVQEPEKTVTPFLVIVYHGGGVKGLKGTKGE